MRLQKCLYLLQEAGCKLGAEYCLHYYGPYSHDVAAKVDELSSRGVFNETAVPNPAGVGYSYEITDKGKALLANYEKTPEGKNALESLEPYVARFGELAKVPLKQIEYAATIAFFHNQGEQWPEATNLTGRFKQVQPSSEIMKEAQKLAQAFAN
jgi:hypothetical protein